MNSTRNRRKFKMGQGLVEFALVIPVLLLILWGLIEFSRIFQGYLTVQHAAREGARYAVTGQSILISDDDNIPGNNSPGEVWAARTTSIISKTHEAALGLNIGDFADTPINQWTTNQDSPYYFDVVLNPVSGGDPYGLGGQDMITVTVHYNVPILTPLVKDVLGGVIHVTGQVMMQNEAFDPTPGARYYATLPAGTATATPIGGATATATINFNTPTNTPPVTGTATITPTMTSTPTSTSTPVPPTPTTPAPTSTPTTAVDILTINEPVTEGDTVITGTGTPGNTVILRDFSQTNAPVIGTGTIQPDGTFSINVTSLIAHHVIVGVAGTASDYAIVQPLATATPVPTIAPTATPSATCFTSSTTQNNIPASADITTFTLGSLTGIDDGDKMKVVVNDGTHTWEYKIDFKGNPAKIDKIQIKLDGNKVYEHKNLGMTIPASLDLLDMLSVTGDTTNYDYDSSAVGIGGANSMTVEFTRDNGATAGACVTTAGGSTTPPTPPPSGNTCFTGSYTQNNIPGSADVVDFTLSNLTGIDDRDKLKVTVDDGVHTWEYKIDFKGNPAKIDKIQIKLDGAKVYDPGGGLGLAIPASLNLLDMTTVTGDTTNYDYDSSAVGIGGANSMTVEFTRDNGATAGACVAVSATPPPTATPMPTPTATPSGADLVITGMQVLTNTAVTVNQPITVSVVIKNQGSIDVSSLSWAYLYGDPAAPPTIGVPGDDWAGVDTLLAGSQFTVTLNYPGFATPGDHVFYAQADTWNQINELNEANNVFGPITVTVSSGGGPVATATPTATAVPNPGGISGSTLLLINGDLVPIGQVALECRVGTTVIATTVSDATGAFDFGMTLPAGTYDVYGDVTVGNVLYTDLQVGVVVTSGSSTIISLILTP